MQTTWWRNRWWLAAGLILVLAGGVVLVQRAVERERALFETDARIVHRLLSQRVVQHDAILATLSLLQPTAQAAGAGSAEQRLPALYPRILRVQRSSADAPWSSPALVAAETASREQQRPTLATVDFAAGQYELVLSAQPHSYALSIDLRALVPWDEWPMAPETSLVRVWLTHAGQRFDVQTGQPLAGESTSGWRFDFQKPLATSSQPFDVRAERRLSWSQLPWAVWLLWSALVSTLLAVLMQLQRQRSERRRAEELLRLGQVARLNTLGELAAGMAHELNQPLTAMLASAQAAQRLLDEQPPETETARGAMRQAVAQARRASEVVGRLRTAVERPGSDRATQAVDLKEAVRRALYLLEPECERRGVVPELQVPAPVPVLADPVALEQVIHNLLMNALQALEQVPQGHRRLRVSLREVQKQGELVVADSGPGIATEDMTRLFEPFFSTRAGGLGLGLTLCETLVGSMGGSLTAANQTPAGAVLTLRLPLAVGKV